MPNNTVSDWPTDPATITEVGGVELRENQMYGRDVNNAFRTMMAQIAVGVGPATTVDNTVARYNGTTGKLQGSGVVVDDSNNVSGAGTISSGAITAQSADGSPLTAFGGDGVNTNAIVEAYGTSNFALVRLQSGAGTKASPTARQSAEVIGSFNFFGHNGSAFPSIANARVAAVAEENFTTLLNGTSLRFEATPIGSTTRAERMRIKEGVYHPSATGGDKGDNTINFGGYYVNGVQVSPPGSPVTKTADFTVAVSEQYLINNKSGSTCTVTLPTASSFPGRKLTVKTIQAQTTVSASSNVVPLGTATAGTAILSANAGRWAKLVSDGTNWIIMEGVV